jgi:hypothetical protein
MEEKNNGKIIESIDKKGYIWRVEIIKEGLSLNNNFYSEKVLIDAVDKRLFEGVRSFARSDIEHLKNINESVQNVVGWFDNVRYSSTQKAVEGNFHITKDAEWLRQKALTAYESNKYDLFGFSIIGEMMVIPEVMNSKNINKVIEIIKIDSIDPVVNPSAGGGIIEIIEAKINNHMEVKNIMNNEVKNSEINSEEAKSCAFDNQISEQKEVELNANGIEELKNLNESYNKIRILETRLMLNETLNKTNLPQPVKEKIKLFCEGKMLNETEIKSLVNIEQDAYAKVIDSLRVKESAFGSHIDISFGRDNKEKLQEALDNFFFNGIKLTDEEKKSESNFSNSFKSIREAYIQFTGDANVTGQMKNVKLSESIDTSTFANALANSITKKMVRDYNLMGLDTWREFVDLVPVSDFKQQERIRIGGYGNLPSVSQGNSYQALTSPTDEKVTYSINKYGGIETLTLEAIKNDDVYALRKIPTNLARAAAQTLHEHIYNWFKNNTTIYDSKSFFHNDHNNLGSAALDATSLAAGRLAVKKQTQSNSNKSLGIRTKYLLVPADLEVTAYNLTRLGYGQYNEVPTFLQEQHIIPIVVNYWSDVNNWYLVADPKDAVCIEVGFLDGKEEPEIFIQDQPNIGSLFTNDTITFKIRHIYSSAVIDYRAAYGAVVA